MLKSIEPYSRAITVLQWDCCLTIINTHDMLAHCMLDWNHNDVQESFLLKLYSRVITHREKKICDFISK